MPRARPARFGVRVPQRRAGRRRLAELDRVDERRAARRLGGQRVHDVALHAVEQSAEHLDGVVDDLCRALLGAVKKPARHLELGGEHGTAADLERVRQLLEQLEGKQEISRLLESALASSATKIFIGSENKLFSLSGSSVIAAPYRGADGRVVGVVGVIGPTRLNYARVIPMVDFTAQTLSRLMR